MSLNTNTNEACNLKKTRVMLLEVDATLSPTDRDKHGDRYDTFAIARGVRRAGVRCDVFQIVGDNSLRDDDANKLAAFYSKRYAGVIVRINPGCLQTAPACVLLVLRTLITRMRLEKRVIWPDRALTRHFGSKISACKFSTSSKTWGISDTRVYRYESEFINGLRGSLGRTRARVVKPIYGWCGEGVWFCSRLETAVDPIPKDDEKLYLMEMSANDHIECRPFREFVEYFLYGTQRTPWRASKRGGGHYDPPDRSMSAPEPFALEQRYLPNIQNGELRLVFVRERLVESVLRTPAPRGRSTIGGVGFTRFVTDDAPDDAARMQVSFIFIATMPTMTTVRAESVRAQVAREFEASGLREVYRLLFDDGCASAALPALWCVDLIEDDDGAYKVCEFNCSCVGLLRLLPACGPTRSAENIPAIDMDLGNNVADEL
eukprot:gene18810-22473_t